MEEIVSFMPMICFCLLFLILVAGFIILIVFLLGKAKKDEWKATVIDKKVNTSLDDDGDTTEIYCVVVNTDNGIKRNIAVSRKEYDDYKVGDRIEKIKGEMKPKKVI